MKIVILKCHLSQNGISVLVEMHCGGREIINKECQENSTLSFFDKCSTILEQDKRNFEVGCISRNNNKVSKYFFKVYHMPASVLRI